jgi:hypothetical protein
MAVRIFEVGATLALPLVHCSEILEILCGNKSSKNIQLLLRQPSENLHVAYRYTAITDEPLKLDV